MFENTLSDNLSLGYNVGAEWDGLTPSPATFLALGLGYSIAEDLGCFAALGGEGEGGLLYHTCAKVRIFLYFRSLRFGISLALHYLCKKYDNEKIIPYIHIRTAMWDDADESTGEGS